jgi:hypothetical protein
LKYFRNFLNFSILFLLKIIEGQVDDWILEAGCGEMDWIDVAQDGDKWRALVDTVMDVSKGKMYSCSCAYVYNTL